MGVLRRKKQILFILIFTEALFIFARLFLNIYGNCIKYNREKMGTIMTSVESLGDKDGICTYRWTISDNGMGMSKEIFVS